LPPPALNRIVQAGLPCDRAIVPTLGGRFDPILAFLVAPMLSMSVV
jgi:hypothetical protein